MPTATHLDLDPLPIVDAHHHLWDLSGSLRYPWLEHPETNWLGDYSAIRRTYLPAEYRRDTALHNLVATVHIEAECDRAQQVEETEWLTAISRVTGMPNAIVAHAWVDQPNSRDILARQAAFPLLRGIRTKPIISPTPDGSVRGEPRSMQDEKWLDGLGLLQEFGLSWDLRVPWWHLEEAADVARHYPALPIVLNHTGYPWHRDAVSLERWRRGMGALAECENVCCKISGLCVEGQPWTLAANQPLILDTIALFGSHRCMFASNFPVDGLKGSWDYIFSAFRQAVAHLPIDQQRDMFANNAARFYRITLTDETTQDAASVVHDGVEPIANRLPGPPRQGGQVYDES